MCECEEKKQGRENCALLVVISEKDSKGFSLHIVKTLFSEDQCEFDFGNQGYKGLFYFGNQGQKGLFYFIQIIEYTEYVISLHFIAVYL